ncbi:hypothetical protein EI94DRAFT_1143238 [Lactarius quietus]|nr:hypothetical protein EI94DRAFT_1143238 [Lactarius quietus]
MDPSSNLDSLFLQYETSMTPNDVRQENPSPHLTQHYDTSQQPPGAEVAGHTTFSFPGQAEPSLQNSLPQGHIHIEEDASRMLTQYPVKFQGHEQEAGLYPPSPLSSDSPPPSHASQLRASLSDQWNSSFPTPDTSGNLYPHHIPTHSRSFSQPTLTRTQTPHEMRARAGVDVRVPQTEYYKSPFTVMQHLPTPGVHSLYVQPPSGLNGTPGLAHLEFTRRHSEADVLGAQGMLSTLFAASNHQSALAIDQPHSERPTFSLAPSASQGLCASFTEAVQGPSSGSEGDYLPDQSPTPSGSQEDCSMSVVSVGLSPEPFSMAELDATDAPSQAASHSAPHKNIPPTSPWLQSSRPLRDGGNLSDPVAAKGLKSPKCGRTSKRHKGPMDPRAARRLEKQRRTDEDNIKVLWNLFVPKGEKPVLKKDRLEMIAHHATLWMDSYRNVLPYLASLEDQRRAGEGSAAQTELGVSQRQGQLVRESNHALGFATFYDVNELGLDDTVGSTTSGLQKQSLFLTHRPN